MRRLWKWLTSQEYVKTAGRNARPCFLSHFPKCMYSKKEVYNSMGMYYNELKEAVL